MGSGSSTSQKNNNNNNTILDIEIPSNIPLLPTDKSDRSDTHISKCKSQDIKSKSQDIKSKNHIKYLDDKYKTI
tara:strand:- start:635 stop:856 length:222 start_codon:yes stop_codon:yes gene_type:complete